MRRSPCIAWLFAMTACGRLDFERRGARDADVATDGPADVAADASEVGPCTGAPIFDDSFEDGSPGPLFEVPSSPSMITASETGGELLFDYTASANRGYRSYRSVAEYPLGGLCIVLDVSRLVACTECGTFFKLYDSANAAEHYAYAPGALVLAMRTHENATEGAGEVEHLHDIELDPVAARFWRIQQVGNMTYWDTSADGVRFQRHYATADLFADATVRVQFGAGTEVAVTNGGIAGFRQVTAFGP